MVSDLFKTRRRKIAVLGSALAVVFAVAAYAYLTSSGSGSGSGSVTATASPVSLTVSQPAFAALGETKTVTVSAKNNGTSPQKVTSVSVLTATPAAGCPAGSFVVGTIASTPVEIAAGGTASVATAPVTFTNVDADQNGCLGADKVSYSATSN